MGISFYLVKQSADRQVGMLLEIAYPDGLRNSMRAILKQLTFVACALVLVLAAALLLTTDREPLVNRAAEITPESIGRAKRILDTNDPRRLQTGQRRMISLSYADLDLAANYLAQQYTGGSARVVFHGNHARLTASVPVAILRIRTYVNVDALFAEATPLPAVTRLRLGRLPIPQPVADWMLQRMIMDAIGEEAYQAGMTAIKKFAIGNGRIAVTYQWHSDFKENIRSALLPPEDRERIEVYQRRLSEVTRSTSSSNVALTELLPPMFKLARERSRRADPLAENRAAILILSFYVNHEPLHTLLPAAGDWPLPLAHTTTLNGREDFSKHFIISAVLAAKAGGVLADAVGVYKELNDSRGGSGFSFGDIAADRAGTRFGEEAIKTPDSARKLQQRVAAGIVDRDIISDTEDLPEYISEADFKRRFGGVDGAAYRKMMSDIEQRVAALVLYR